MGSKSCRSEIRDLLILHWEPLNYKSPMDLPYFYKIILLFIYDNIITHGPSNDDVRLSKLHVALAILKFKSPGPDALVPVHGPSK